MGKRFRSHRRSRRSAPFGIETLEPRTFFTTAAPAGVAASAPSSTRIDLTWTESSPNITGFQIQRAIDGGAFAPLVNVGNVTHVSDTLVTAGTKYTYRLRASGAGGTSDYSVPITDNTLAYFGDNGHPAPARIHNYQCAYPVSRVNPITNHRNNVFYVGQPVVFTFQWDQGQAKTYEVRDYYGQLILGGAAPAPGTSLTLRIRQPGWYKLYVFGATNDPTFGDSLGGTIFNVFRSDPNFPAMPGKEVVDPDPGMDEVVRGVTGMGPQRLKVDDATNPDAAIAAVAPEVALDKQYYLPYDPVRNRSDLLAFPNGTRNLSDPSQDAVYLAGVRKIVERFHNDIKYYEGRNEPNFFETPEQYVQEIKALYETVKSVDPTCKVIGPGVVDILGGYGLQWLDRFLAAGGGNYIDAVSFHAYNSVNGDVSLARRCLDGLKWEMNKFGVGNMEIWQTEQGSYAAMYGTYDPRHQGRWTMLQRMIFEQYGITKEHNVLWYDRSGYWDVPAFWECWDDGSLNPAAPLMRVYSEEVFGTTYSKAYDFGASGQNMYVGNLYTGPGKSVAAFMSAGSTDGKVHLSVTGGTSLRVVSAFGVAINVPVVNGQAVIDVPELPVYVEMAAGQTIDVIPQDWGPDLALQPGVTAKTSGNGQHPLGGSYQNSISKVFDGIHQSWYSNQSPDGDVWYDNTPAGQTPWFELDLPAAQSVNKVVIYSGVPWQWRGSLLDYELQYDNNGNWTTIEHVQENPKSIGVHSEWERSTVDSFYSDRYVFRHEFAPVTTGKIRILVHDVTWGGGATQMETEAGGQTGFHVMNLSELEVYGPTAAPSARLTAPVMSTAAPTYNFTVTYTSAAGIDLSTIGDDDFIATAGRRWRVMAHVTALAFRRRDPKHTSVTVTYSLSQPAGSWTAANNGPYTLSMQDNSVRDLNGNATGSGISTGVQVNITAATR